MTPVWRLHNGRGPSWQYGQAQVTTETSFQVVFKAKECFTAVSLKLSLVESSFLFAGYHRRHLGQQSCQRLPCCWWCHILRWGWFIDFKTDLQSIFRCVPQSLSQLWSSRESAPLTGTPVGGGTPQLWVSTSSKSHSKQIVLADNFDNWK